MVYLICTECHTENVQQSYEKLQKWEIQIEKAKKPHLKHANLKQITQNVDFQIL